MRQKIAFRVAYFLVTTGFTLLLIGFILTVIWAVIGFLNLSDEGSGRQVKIEITGGAPSKKVVGIIEEEKQVVVDTLFIMKEDYYLSTSAPSINLYVSYFRHSHIVSYIFLELKEIIFVFLWLFILYQVFLILYDMGDERFFITQNSLRMKKVGFCLVALSALNIFRYHYRGYLTQNDHLVITGKYTRFFTGDFFIYLAVGCLVIVFSWMFRYGMRLQEENEMTV